MDVFSRLYHIARAISAGDYAEREIPTAEDWHGYGASDTAGKSPSPVSTPDPVLAGYYANLDLPYGADLAAVKTAWKRLMKKYHPDRHAQNPSKRQVANE
ncbi:MAG: J domain-containing protein, partial [Candidatus Latescibacteria bacterium]|nr:J domain-containing protein [Candidatus Latescibacterota bacterium]